ncbi:hypothetical protein EG329_006831 [Mollisiaceae sp. DMI_Dod_QoI]|nr:hypothetical protein EG329_006831 [Helotiales sp. DMI_Dod_QoI]
MAEWLREYTSIEDDCVADELAVVVRDVIEAGENMVEIEVALWEEGQLEAVEEVV